MTDWEIAFAKGSAVDLLRGVIGVASAPAGHHPGYFSGDLTAIMGSEDEAVMQTIPSNAASWEVSMPSADVAAYSKGFLAIGCIRYYGGLHSRKYDVGADISLNGSPIDRILLRDKPSGHSDYFYQIPKPAGMPDISPLAECRNVYGWPLLPSHLKREGSQVVEIEIDAYANWDIDYVGLIYQLSRRHQVFVCYSHVDRKVAKRLVKGMSELGISAWVDVQDMSIGDSLSHRIAAALDGVEYVIALLSRASVSSAWVQRELEIAIHREIDGRRTVVLPILLDDCEIPAFLRGKVYGDLRGRRNYRRVLQSIAVLLG